MIYHSKGLESEITDFEYHHDLAHTGKIIPSQTPKYAMLCETESSIPRAS